MSHEYEDLLHLPHHVSSTHPQMSRMERAAQFAPFAALTGYDDAVKETARQTQPRIELDEYEQAELNHRLNQALETHSVVRVTYFVPDCRKSGGSYASVIGIIRKIDTLNQLLSLEDGTRFPIMDILQITPTETSDIDKIDKV